MKLKSFPLLPTLGAVSVAGIMFVAPSRAQSGDPFDLSWFALGGGGGASSGGQFQINGIIGQPDAGTLAGGNFKLESGFWCGITLQQTASAPLLKLELLGNGQAVISWPISVSGFSLEETVTAAQPNSWSHTPQPVVDTVTEHTVTLPAVGLIKCYRLKTP